MARLLSCSEFRLQKAPSSHGVNHPPARDSQAPLVSRIHKRYGMVLLPKLDILDAYAFFNMYSGITTELSKIVFENAAVELV